jgi:hypothetical protein
MLFEFSSDRSGGDEINGNISIREKQKEQESGKKQT